MGKNFRKELLVIQMEFALNGNIKPCPYVEQCSTYKIGCNGESWWCKQKGIGYGIRTQSGEFRTEDGS